SEARDPDEPRVQAARGRRAAPDGALVAQDISTGRPGSALAARSAIPESAESPTGTRAGQCKEGCGGDEQARAVHDGLAAAHRCTQGLRAATRGRSSAMDDRGIPGLVVRAGLEDC